MGRSGVFCPACSDPGQQWTVEIALFLRLNGFDNQDDFGYSQILVLNVAICTFSFAASTHWPCMLATLHFQATTCTISDICLPMSSRLMLRKHSFFFHLQDCFVRAAALLQRALHSTLGVPSPTVCSWS